MSKQTEEFKVTGKELVDRIKALIKEGNIRRITIVNKEGKHILVLPLTFGLVGAVLAPMLAAVGAAAALLSECTIIVERTDKK
jgi:CBS domain-containing protein